MVQLSGWFWFVMHQMSWSYNPESAVTLSVWAVPLSLAATRRITLVFSSSAYLDVSVQRVNFLTDNIPSVCWVAPFGYLPVSYTHLRAHETPEHLVCRLLLEKKKKKKKYEKQRRIRI
eukprot:TRINITY_DN5909_c0_g1_i6.p1 TRINITY_DN5909_c0_g1~~TRINITY_DN5909_c0_g1_i6.p1  ORF type:complete len:118 (-),score=17.37 TRINITY_DN5909_c0_g1_i6:73-426(-)